MIFPVTLQHYGQSTEMDVTGISGETSLLRVGILLHWLNPGLQFFDSFVKGVKIKGLPVYEGITHRIVVTFPFLDKWFGNLEVYWISMILYWVSSICVFDTRFLYTNHKQTRAWMYYDFRWFFHPIACSVSRYCWCGWFGVSGHFRSSIPSCNAGRM